MTHLHDCSLRCYYKVSVRWQTKQYMLGPRRLPGPASNSLTDYPMARQAMVPKSKMGLAVLLSALQLFSSRVERHQFSHTSPCEDPTAASITS
jgi:hypothetical protein